MQRIETVQINMVCDSHSFKSTYCVPDNEDKVMSKPS